MDDKQSLRKALRLRRNAFVGSISPSESPLCFSRPPRPLAELFAKARTVAGYVPVGSEADPRSLMVQAQSEHGCALCLPHVVSKVAPMRFLAWSPDDTLESGPFGLSQPQDTSPEVAPDLVLVPMLGFDRAGNRLGQGAGHYDRALSLLPDALRIGIAWSAQQQDELPADPWDEPLDAICTECEWIIPQQGRLSS